MTTRSHHEPAVHYTWPEHPLRILSLAQFPSLQCRSYGRSTKEDISGHLYFSVDQFLLLRITFCYQGKEREQKKGDKQRIAKRWENSSY